MELCASDAIGRRAPETELSNGGVDMAGKRLFATDVSIAGTAAA